MVKYEFCGTEQTWKETCPMRGAIEVEHRLRSAPKCGKTVGNRPDQEENPYRENLSADGCAVIL